jgi:hypothetical protein
MVGQYYYVGSQTEKPDYKKALHYFTLAAKQHPDQAALLAKEVPSFLRQAALAASQASGYLGEMYLRSLR